MDFDSFRYLYYYLSWDTIRVRWALHYLKESDECQRAQVNSAAVFDFSKSSFLGP